MHPLARADGAWAEGALSSHHLTRTAGARGLPGVGLGGRLEARGEDVCRLGVCSRHAEVGITVADSEEALVKRLMIAQSGEVIAVAVADKLGTALPYVVGPARELTHLVVEHFVPDEVIAPYAALGISVLRG